MDTSDGFSGSGFLKDVSHPPLDASFTDITPFYISSKGCNVLYKARRLGKWFILKGLKKEYAGHPICRELLRKEFEIGYHLSHPNIAQTFGWEEVPDCGTCIVMEYVDGDALRNLLASSGCNKRTALHLVEELCNALAYLHSKQVVHRDLKPENILITHNGQHIKLIDFGFSDADDYAMLKEPAGTRRYAAPELIAGNCTADGRMDIYSLGIILQEMRPADAVFQSVGKQCCRKQPSLRPMHAEDVPLLLQKKYQRQRQLRTGSACLVLAITLSCVFFLANAWFAKERPTESLVPTVAQTDNSAHDTIPVNTSIPQTSKGKPTNLLTKQKTQANQPPAGPMPVASRLPSVTGFLGNPYTKAPTVYAGTQHEYDLLYTTSMHISDRMLAVMQQLDGITSCDSLLALQQTIEKKGGLRTWFKEELYRQEKDYQQQNGIHEKPFRIIDYQTDQTYHQLKGLFRPFVAAKINELCPPGYPLSFDERTYQHISASAFRHFSHTLQACDTMRSDTSVTRFLVGYWKHKARTETTTWLSEQIAPESAIYTQCQEIISSAIAAQEKAYGYLIHRKTLEMEKRLGRHLGIVTESEETLPDGTIRKRTLKEDDTWRIEMHDPKTLEALKDDDGIY